jgi:SpoVK/Ycf46/Vps4 family AAA+-type ATPase
MEAEVSEGTVAALAARVVAGVATAVARNEGERRSRRISDRRQRTVYASEVASGQQGQLALAAGTDTFSNPDADKVEYSNANAEALQLVQRDALKQRAAAKKLDQKQRAADAAALRNAKGGGDRANRQQMQDDMEQLVERDRLAIQDMVAGGATGLDNVSGNAEAVHAMRAAAVLRFTMPFIYGKAPPAGILLCGPPGTGKTHAARCCAIEAAREGAKVTFVSVNGKDLGSAYHSESETKVTTLFEVAKKKAPSIIFIDELDKVLPHGGDNRSTEQQPWRRFRRPCRDFTIAGTSS